MGLSHHEDGGGGAAASARRAGRPGRGGRCRARHVLPRATRSLANAAVARRRQSKDDDDGVGQLNNVTIS